MSTYEMTLTPFESRLNGEPLLLARLTLDDGGDFLSAYCVEHDLGDPSTDEFWQDRMADEYIGQAMRASTDLMTMALGLTPAQVDVEGLNGDLFVRPSLVPEQHRGGGTLRVSLTIETPTRIAWRA